jgi:hypothetical protein
MDERGSNPYMSDFTITRRPALEHTQSIYDGVFKSFQTSSVTKHTLCYWSSLFRKKQLVPFLVYAGGPVFLPLLTAPLELTFWNRV